MSGTSAILYVICLSLLIGFLTGWIVKKRGYSFGRYFVTGFIASCGILGIVFKIIMDYLK